MAKSSIHIQRAVEGSVGHNSREHFSYSVVFTDDGEQNECTHTVDEAYSIYREELHQRTQAYTERTGQKLQKSAVTQLSAILNLEQHHTLKDLESIKNHLEKTFGTKVYQMAIHRDEGKLISKVDGTELYSGKDFFLNPENKKFYFDKQFTKEIDLKDFKIQKNYHAHIEMMGLDKDGNAIRQKMNKRVLKEMQTFVAKELKMERGKENISYSQEEMKQILAVTGNKNDYESNTLFAKKFNEVAKELGFYKERNKRRDTHIYKDVGAEREGAKREALKENQALKEQIQELKKENSSLKGQNTKNKKELEKLKEENKDLKIDNEALKNSKKELEEEIKNLSKELRESLKELGAIRPHYAQLDNLNKELREELKNELLNHEKVIKSYEDLEQKLREELTKKDEKINDLEAENQDLKSALEALKYNLEIKEKRSNSYFGLNKELKEEISSLKEQINDLEEQNNSLSSKVIDLEEKVASKPNMSEREKEAEQFLEGLTNKYSKAQEALKKMNDNKNDLKSYFAEKLSAKFDEVDKKVELEQSNEAPVKKRSYGRER